LTLRRGSGNGFSVSQGLPFNLQLKALNTGVEIYNDVMEALLDSATL
jgi:hypothetical protein